MTHSAGLAGEPASLDRAHDIELTEPVGRDKRLIDDHPQHRPREIDRAFAAVDIDFAVARFDPNTGDGVLALAGGIGSTERVAPRFDVDRHRGWDWGRRWRRGPSLLQCLTQAAQALESLSARALWRIVVGHRYWALAFLRFK